jgi:hypothetical protein
MTLCDLSGRRISERSKLGQPSDAPAAATAIVDAVAAGDLTPTEAAELSRVVST